MDISPTLPDALHLLFGPEWRRRAPLAVGRSRRQIGRWCSGETLTPRRFLILFQRAVDKEANEIERWRRDQHRRVDKDFRAREGDLGQARMWLRVMLFDRPEWEPRPKVGRPRKRIPTAAIGKSRASRSGGYLRQSR
jgi:hypothetical protein